MELNNVLRNFYLDIRKVDGEKYKTSRLEISRHSLSRYMETAANNNKIKDTVLSDANLSYRKMMTELKEDGFGITKHNPIISTTDLEKLYKSYLFNIDIPLGLMN